MPEGLRYQQTGSITSPRSIERSRTSKVNLNALGDLGIGMVQDLLEAQQSPANLDKEQESERQLLGLHAGGSGLG